MIDGKFYMRVSGIAVAMTAAFAGIANADTIAAYPNLSFVRPRGHGKNLDSAITPALQGTVELEYKTKAKNGCLWAITNAAHSAEYMISLHNGKLCAWIWVKGSGCVFNQSATPSDGMDGWHSVCLSWRQGSNTVFIVDGNVQSAANSAPLRSFATTKGYHQLGENNVRLHSPFCYVGEMRNVVIRDTYETLNPSTPALLTVALLGLVAYAWRKRSWSGNVDGSSL